jgi:hypothetical protein
VRIGGTSICWTPFFAWICALILAAAAAAAAAAPVNLPLSELAGLSETPRSKGLRARRDSGSLLGGDRERRSKRERDGRSDSSLSKRERGRCWSDMVCRCRLAMQRRGCRRTKTGCLENMVEAYVAKPRGPCTNSLPHIPAPGNRRPRPSTKFIQPVESRPSVLSISTSARPGKLN